MDDNNISNEHPNGYGNGSGLYVDVENLQADSQQLIQSLIDNWPEIAPYPSRLVVYVRADLVDLWQLWARSQFGIVEVVVKGVQHFSASLSKNSADIAIATTAMADFVLRRVSHVGVFSDDSDFISLFGAIREELNQPQYNKIKVPFLWVVTDRPTSLSATVSQFFPHEHLHVVKVERGEAEVAKPSGSTICQVMPTSSKPAPGLWAEMARVIVERIEVGVFKSTDCQPIIQELWPQHPMATSSKPAFGLEFQKNVWPELESLGGEIANPGKKPIRYEVTEDAKRRLQKIP